MLFYAFSHRQQLFSYPFSTPIMNSLVDCYGYLRFLKIRPWYDWQEFNVHIARKEKKNRACFLPTNIFVCADVDLITSCACCYTAAGHSQALPDPSY